MCSTKENYVPHLEVLEVQVSKFKTQPFDHCKRGRGTGLGSASQVAADFLYRLKPKLSPRAYSRKKGSMT